MSINTDIERDGLNSCPEKTQPEMTDHNQTTKRKPTAEFSIAESPKKLCTRVDPEKLGKSQTSDQTPVMVANNPDETSGHGGSELPHTSSMEENTALMNVNIGPKIRAQLQEPCSPGDANLASTSTATMNHLGVDSVPKKMNGTAADSQIKVGSAQKPIKSGSKKTTSEAYVQTEINARQLMLEMNEMKSINAALRQEIDELKNRMYKFVSILDPNSDLGEVNDIGKLVLSMIKNQEESDEMP
ncbi:hypothetical protein EGW08_021850 [Elysia chlorotica]|uniref:Uncharacterized protein n=1 Tax=Elysia chlorotica TaxID=188477 RepID=A0A3S1AWW2_ELYCH|nr:hypothetical protein EGW08_021850 [Elysia chlorotica]